MPFTPFHMGPGIAIKAVLQGSFSLMVFGWAQILMDLQPLFALITGEGRLHGFSHTFLGASLITLAAAVTGKYLSELAFKFFRLLQEGPAIHIQWWIAFVSAAIGCFSHVILDGIIHGDMTPFQPLTDLNPLLGLITVEHLHDFCMVTGYLGTVVYFIIRVLVGLGVIGKSPSR